MKKNKRWWLMIPIVCLAVITGGIVVSQTTKTEAAPTPDGYLALEKAPNAHLINSTTGLADEEIPPEYGAFFQLNQNTYYTSSDSITRYNTQGYTDGRNPLDTSKSNTFEITPAAVNPEITIHNAGFYQGRSIDVKLVINEAHSTSLLPKFFFHGIMYSDKDNSADYLFNKSNGITLENLYFGFLHQQFDTDASWYGSLYEGDYLDYTWEFYDTETGLPIDYKGLWNASNINKIKYFDIDHADSTDFSNFYVPTNSQVGYEVLDGRLSFTGEGSAEGAPEHKFSYTFEGTSLDQRFTKGYVEPPAGRPPEPGRYSGALGVLYDGQAISRVGHTAPAVQGIKNERTHNQAGYQDLHYKITQTVSNNRLDEQVDFRDDSFRIESTLPSTDFDIDQSRVTVTDEISGENVTTQFDIQVSADGQTLSVSPLDPKADSFNGNTFTIDVYATPNSSFDVLNTQNGYVNNEASVDNGYMVFDMASTNTTLTYETAAFGVKNFDAIVDGNHAQAKTLYEGVPSATPKPDLTIEMDGDLETVFANPETSMLDNVAIDTNNMSFDGPVDVSFPTTLPSTATPGPITVELTLTTARGVTTTVPVEVLVESDTEAPTADPVHQRINILNAADLAAMTPRDFVTNIQDNMSDPANVVVTFDEAPNFEEIVATEGVKTIQIRLTDEANNSQTVSVTITVYDNRITVHFVDGDGTVLAEPLLLPGKPTETVDLATNTDVMANISTVTTNGYTLGTAGRPDPETVTFTEEAQAVSYLFTGILSIQSAPATIDFGNMVFDANIQRKDDPNLHGGTLAIRDTRARVDGGWTLMAEVTEEMTNSDTNSVMSDALKYVDADLNVIDLGSVASEIVVNPTGGDLVVTDSWGNTADSEGLKLVADPSKTSVSSLGSYSGKITWTITVGPVGP